MTVEQDARLQVDRRIHGLKVRLGKARADALEEKIARYGKVEELEEELALLQRSYWEEVAKLEAEAD